MLIKKTARLKDLLMVLDYRSSSQSTVIVAHMAEIRLSDSLSIMEEGQSL